jgi:hypothetical protein
LGDDCEGLDLRLETKGEVDGSLIVFEREEVGQRSTCEGEVY